MSAPAAFASAQVARAMAALPSRSPTVGFNCARLRRKPLGHGGALSVDDIRRCRRRCKQKPPLRPRAGLSPAAPRAKAVARGPPDPLTLPANTTEPGLMALVDRGGNPCSRQPMPWRLAPFLSGRARDGAEATDLTVDIQQLRQRRHLRGQFRNGVPARDRQPTACPTGMNTWASGRWRDPRPGPRDLPPMARSTRGAFVAGRPEGKGASPSPMARLTRGNGPRG